MSNVDPPRSPPTLSLVADPQASLEVTIAGRRAELESRMKSLEADPGLSAAQERDQVAARLSELTHLVKVNVVDGWANLGSMGKARLTEWLAK